MTFFFFFILVIPQFGSVGPMAITLCQSLGQNIGMFRNKEQTTAGDVLTLAEINKNKRLKTQLKPTWEKKVLNDLTFTNFIILVI